MVSKTTQTGALLSTLALCKPGQSASSMVAICHRSPFKPQAPPCGFLLVSSQGNHVTMCWASPNSVHPCQGAQIVETAGEQPQPPNFTQPSRGDPQTWTPMLLPHRTVRRMGRSQS